MCRDVPEALSLCCAVLQVPLVEMEAAQDVPEVLSVRLG